MNSQVQVTASEEVFDEKKDQAYRAGAYSLLAALFRATPDQAMLDYLSNLVDGDAESNELVTAMSALGKMAEHSEIKAIDDEFHDLFVGLGRGQLLPYGSWYQTGFLMEKPLGLLRDDLAKLGYVRSDDISEPEDHIAALSEVMSLLINEGLVAATTSNCVEQQRVFFETHIVVWVEKFFTDLKESSSVNFYRSVADFGIAFINFEKQYLSMNV